MLPDGAPVTVIDRFKGRMYRLNNDMRLPRDSADRIGAVGQVRWPSPVVPRVNGENLDTLIASEEGIWWARGHGRDVEAALLLARSAHVA